MPVAASGPGTVSGNNGFALVCNVVPGDEGRLRVAAFGFALPLSGSGTLFTVTFATAVGVVAGNFSPLNFEGVQFYSNAFPSPPGIPNNPINGSVTLALFTAANVSITGRVSNSAGLPVRNSLVTMTDPNGQVTWAVTNSFGYYHFEDVASQEVYRFNVQAKGYTFVPRTMQVNDNITDLNFVAEPR